MRALVYRAGGTDLGTSMAGDGPFEAMEGEAVDGIALVEEDFRAA
jgi:hypothetical protein